MRRRKVRGWMVVAAAVGLATLLHAPALRSLAAVASISDDPAPAALVIPLGDPAAAARLVAEGYGEFVGVWRGPPSRLVDRGLVQAEDVRQRADLERAGVPPDRIVRLPDPTEDVVQIGRAARSWLLKTTPNQPRRVLLVAPSPWSRLFRRDLRRGLAESAEVVVIATALPNLDERRWWRSEVGLITYLDVYCLWATRLLRG